MDNLLTWLHTGFSAAFAFVLLLGLLIFVHELGHFAVAKWCGVRVEVFSLGFGKKILSYKKGDTVYCLSLVPLGGYVKMFGDEINANISEADKSVSFTHKPVSKRIAIVLAGPLMNFIFAVAIFTTTALMGEDVKAPLIGDLSPNSGAHQAGLRPGDRVVAVGSKKIETWDQFQNQLDGAVGKKALVKVVRHGFEKPVEIEVSPVLKPNPNLLAIKSMIGDLEGLTNQSKAAVIGVRKDTPAEKAGFVVGDQILSVNGVKVRQFRELDTLLIPFQGQEIVFEIERFKSLEAAPEKMTLKAQFRTFSNASILGFESSDLYLLKVTEGSPAEKAGLKAGDRILKIANVEPAVWEEVLNTVKSFKGDSPLEILVQRQGEQHLFKVMPQVTSQLTAQGTEDKRYTIGIIPWVQFSPADLVKLPIDGVFGAISRGYQRSIEVTIMTVMSFVKLLQNQISPKNIGGVISIGQAAHETLQAGLSHFLTMMGAISINLFVLNLLPIPVLDGGHLIFYLIEAVKGSPLNIRKMEIAQQVGLVLLMSLMVFALFNDFTRILGN